MKLTIARGFLIKKNSLEIGILPMFIDYVGIPIYQVSNQVVRQTVVCQSFYSCLDEMYLCIKQIIMDAIKIITFVEEHSMLRKIRIV